MTMSTTNSPILYELRGTIPRHNIGGYIDVPLQLDSLAIRIVRAYEKTKVLTMHSTLESGYQHHLMVLFLELHEHRKLWQSAYLMAMKYKLEVLIQETSLFLEQTDLENFKMSMRNFR